MNKQERISQSFIDRICDLYDDVYDDTVEDSSIGGEDWVPGKRAGHKSLKAFQEELDEKGIHLSTGKIRKILITGGKFSSELSRSVAREWEHYCNLPPVDRRKRVAEVLDISPNTVMAYLPYQRQVYKEEPSQNARSVKRWRDRKREKQLRAEDMEIMEILRKIKSAIGSAETEKMMKRFISRPDRIKNYYEMLKKAEGV